MIQHAWKCLLAVSALLFLAPAAAAVAGDHVPIKGKVTIVPDSSVPPVIISTSPLIVQDTRLISGEARPLGPCTGVIVETITFNSNRTVAAFLGTFTLAGSNGDSITGTAAGTLVFNSETGVFDVTETFVITGGTGRFNGATGSATGEGEASTAGVAQESFKGTLSLPGSRK
jgi:hypothetical protein